MFICWIVWSVFFFFIYFIFRVVRILFFEMGVFLVLGIVRGVFVRGLVFMINEIF